MTIAANILARGEWDDLLYVIAFLVIAVVGAIVDKLNPTFARDRRQSGWR